MSRPSYSPDERNLMGDEEEIDLSPTDGYFNGRQHPQQMMVPDEPEPSTKSAESDRERLFNSYSRSPTEHSERSPLLQNSRSGGSSSPVAAPEPDLYEASELAPPPSYTAAVSTARQSVPSDEDNSQNNMGQAPTSPSYGTVPIAVPFRDNRPESMGPPVDPESGSINHRSYRSRFQRLSDRSRKIIKFTTISFLFIILFISITSSQSSSSGSGSKVLHLPLHATYEYSLP
jgi:hypothetical protein